MKKVYETEVTAWAGRNGLLKSADGVLDLKVSLPKEMGGTGNATNPEQLFAAAWAACFGTSVTIAAGIEKISIGDVNVTAKVEVLHSNGNYDLGAHLQIKIEGVDRDTARKLVEKSKSICSYSKATKGNIETTYEVA
ncbi:MAG: Ohr family peroxiredoxin [Cytophagaceae bacterium]|jgi:Ohr subfamily peroxiredoxin|nr:Ohr family peroxiredoxin [Cytophagaceae bacterium]